MIDERQLRGVLERRAETISATPTDAPKAIRRARRRIAASVGVTAMVVGALALGGVVAVRSMSAPPPRPANPRPTTAPTPLGAGEVLTVLGDGFPDVREGELVAEDPDSGEMRTIVNALDAKALSRGGTPRGILGAAWSRDRRWIAFRATGLWVTATTGGAPRKLTPDQGWYPYAWSPTEDQLAVVYGRDVTLVDAPTGRETHLGTTNGPEDGDGIAVHTLVWSPDGTRIAFDGGPEGGSVYSIDVESGERTLLVRQPAGTGRINDIDWSPDGAHLAISYDDASFDASHEVQGPRANALYIANADGSDLRLLDRVRAGRSGVWTPGLSGGTAWSPDGTRLAYTSLSGPDYREFDVWTVSMDGSAPSLVASRCCWTGSVSSGGPYMATLLAAGPAWSPDGSQIAFETGDGPSNHLVVNADGTGEPREIDELTQLSWAGGWYFCACYG